VNDTAASLTQPKAPCAGPEPGFSDDPSALLARLAAWLTDVALSARARDEVDTAA
jgi:hypothetical protein